MNLSVDKEERTKGNNFMRVRINPKYRISNSVSIAEPECWLWAEGGSWGWGCGHGCRYGCCPAPSHLNSRGIQCSHSSKIKLTTPDVSERWYFTEYSTGSLRMSITSHIPRNALLPLPASPHPAVPAGILFLMQHCRWRGKKPSHQDTYQTGFPNWR